MTTVAAVTELAEKYQSDASGAAAIQPNQFLKRGKGKQQSACLSEAGH